MDICCAQCHTTLRSNCYIKKKKKPRYIQRTASIEGFGMDMLHSACSKVSDMAKNELEDHGKEDEGGFGGTLAAGASNLMGVVDPCSLLFDCSSWQLCRSHIISRCEKYKTLVYGGAGIS